MGEPGTKELLNLEDLEAYGNVRTGRRHILSVLVENKSGVLARIAGLFSRRGFNIEESCHRGISLFVSIPILHSWITV